MIKLTNFLSFRHKMVTKRIALSIARTEDFYCYLIVSFAALACAVNISYSSLTNTLQQEVVTQHDAFEIGHATPRLRSQDTSRDATVKKFKPFHFSVKGSSTPEGVRAKYHAVHRTKRDTSSF